MCEGAQAPRNVANGRRSSFPALKAHSKPFIIIVPLKRVAISQRFGNEPGRGYPADFARINLEELPMFEQELEATVAELTAPGKGILAADESMSTMNKRLAKNNIAQTEDMRRDYREMLFSTPGLGEFISGAILFDEQIRQNAKSGGALPKLLEKQGIMPGIKVDKGPVALPNYPDETFTQGLDGLDGRLEEYKKLGARFAKWRAVINIDTAKGIPSAFSTRINAVGLAQYAALCQQHGIVPIVEPEVLMDGDHTLETCASVTEATLQAVFHALHGHRVRLEHMVLKPNMVVPGAKCKTQASPQKVAEATVACLKRTVPSAVHGIFFLSGGQGDMMAAANLNAINNLAEKQKLPWVLSSSFGRALVSSALETWGGKEQNFEAGQKVLYKRARLVSMARRGQYKEKMEKEPA
jgi:fructose-bisphosphate aldolase class I